MKISPDSEEPRYNFLKKYEDSLLIHYDLFSHNLAAAKILKSSVSSYKDLPPRYWHNLYSFVTYFLIDE